MYNAEIPAEPRSAAFIIMTQKPVIRYIIFLINMYLCFKNTEK